ncbi:hypothetical protein BDU57DRAFT_454735 [Ampelomyces quisqualis]|uniref:Uncharacterized protein n=1 Tax=Ampelomyces quisqualis TaxID=50730 RepID=A0A6A5QHE1_AMPQU|nr:hypothetical protein BDU57DRAFT_454735 [Ampelomyces quisqualis]
MPTYHACGVSVRLGVAPLVDTVNPDIVLNKADIDKKRCEEIEQNLLKSELLREKRVSFPGDERDFGLNWLGNVPFMQVQAGHDLFRHDNDDAPEFAATVNPSHLQPRSPIYSTTTSLPGPLALSLHVLSSDRTFASGLDSQNRPHLKIEVLFNGKLSNCFFLPPYEVRSGTKTHHQVFAGYRTDYLAERPWVILPPRVCADGSFARTEDSTAPETRWKDICQALSQEANARGSDRQGNLPPSATFLRALADMEMPHQTKAMHKPNIKSFGVIDVLITAGHGRKVTSGKGYLKAPQRFIDDSFSSDHDLTGESDSNDERPFKRRAITPLILPKSRDSRPVYPVISQTSIEYERKSTMSVPLGAMPAESLFPATPTPLPYSSQFSDQTLGDPRNAPIHVPAYGNAAFPSSPLQQDSLSINRPIRQFLSRIPTSGNGNKKNIPVVDHSWAVPQCITLNSTPASLVESSVYTEIASSRRSSGSSYHPKPEQSSLAHASSTQASNRNALGDGYGSKPTRSLQAPEKDADSVLKIDSIAVGEPAEPSHNADSGTGELNKGPTPQQRTASGTQIRGVQGPKATTFWLDDPEEILRGFAKAQRSKPPVRRKNTASTSVQLKDATQVSETPIVLATSSSSPLSSPPTTPELEARTIMSTTNITSTATPKAGPKDPIAQIDGTLERKMAAPLLPKLTQFPKELDLSATPQLPATSGPIPTTNAKKRKTPHRSPAKPSRNLGRHKTVENPLLNQNCVIAFAESEDKKSEKGVLRQVKSERQGVFKEEYVVFATRFYVPGN